MPPKRLKSPKKSLAEVLADEKAKFQLKSNKAAAEILKNGSPSVIASSPKNIISSASPSPLNKATSVTKSDTKLRTPSPKNYIFKSPIPSPASVKKASNAASSNGPSRSSTANIKKNITNIESVNDNQSLDEGRGSSCATKRVRVLRQNKSPPFSLDEDMDDGASTSKAVPDENSSDNVEEVEQHEEDYLPTNSALLSPSLSDEELLQQFTVPKNYYSAMLVDGIVVVLLAVCIYSYIIMPDHTPLNTSIDMIITTIATAKKLLVTYSSIIIVCFLVLSMLVYWLQLRLHSNNRKKDIMTVLVRLLRHHIRYKKLPKKSIDQILHYGGVVTSDQTDGPVGYPSSTHMEEIIDQYMYPNMDNHIQNQLLHIGISEEAESKSNANKKDLKLNLNVIPIDNIVLSELFPDITRIEIMSLWNEIELNVLKADTRIKSYFHSLNKASNRNAMELRHDSKQAQLMFYWTDGVEPVHHMELEEQEHVESKPVIYANTGLNYSSM